MKTNSCLERADYLEMDMKKNTKIPEFNFNTGLTMWEDTGKNIWRTQSKFTYKATDDLKLEQEYEYIMHSNTERWFRQWDHPVLK